MVKVCRGLLLGSCLILLCCSGSRRTAVTRTVSETEFRAALASGVGTIELPRGVLVIHSALEIPDRANDLEIRGHPSGSTLRAGDDFKGRAVLVARAASNLRLTGFEIDGNRDKLASPIYLPPSDVPFARYYSNNGILLESVSKAAVRRIQFTRIANFSLLVSASSEVAIEDVKIEDCGSLNSSGRNNTSGGILIEEGTSGFVVRRSIIRRVRGNAIWTHSNYHSPRNSGGIIADNEVYDVARDAIQVGHATNVKVTGNRGARIGYPVNEVDRETDAIPVAIDTAGDVDLSAYLSNRFQDVNGQCIDLDGFHHGEVRRNSCVNRKPLEEYPYAHAGIVFGNSNLDMHSTAVVVAENEIVGTGYNGVVVIGFGHQIVRNRLLDLNRAHCTGDPARPRCNYAVDQPGLLRSGIYLARGAPRPERAEDNLIEGNRITGFGMRDWCIEAAPGVSLSKNQIRNNRCTGER